MYCFANICRLCLKTFSSKLIDLNFIDHYNVKIRDKLEYCFPDIFQGKHKLPEQICLNCCQRLTNSWTFKRMCLKNKQSLIQYSEILKQYRNDSFPSNIDIKICKIHINDIVKQEIKTEENIESFDIYKETDIDFDIDTDTDSDIEIDQEGSVSELLNNTNNLTPTTKVKHFKCEHCGRYYANKYSLRAHIVKKHIQNIKLELDENCYKPPFQCPGCNAIFENVLILRTHFEEHCIGKSKSKNVEKAPNTPYGCPDCSRIFSKPHRLNLHYIEHHNGRLEIDVLNSTIRRIETTDENVPVLTDLKLKPEYHCPKCEKVFDRPFLLRKHFIKCQNAVEKPVIKTKFCECSTSEHFNINMFTPPQVKMENVENVPNETDETMEQTPIMKSICPICNKTFSRPWSLRKHVEKQHKDQTEVALTKSLHICSICNKAYSRLSDYSKHIRNKHEHLNPPPAAPPPPPQIKMETTEIKTEPNDIQTETNVKMETNDTVTEALSRCFCPYCDKSYSRRDKLISHMRSKHSDMPQLYPMSRETNVPLPRFNCSHCDKSYSRHYDLNVHNIKKHNEINSHALAGSNVPQAQYSNYATVISPPHSIDIYDFNTKQIEKTELYNPFTQMNNIVNVVPEEVPLDSESVKIIQELNLNTQYTNMLNVDATKLMNHAKIEESEQMIQELHSSNQYVLNVHQMKYCNNETGVKIEELNPNSNPNHNHNPNPTQYMLNTDGMKFCNNMKETTESSVKIQELNSHPQYILNTDGTICNNIKETTDSDLKIEELNPHPQYMNVDETKFSNTQMFAMVNIKSEIIEQKPEPGPEQIEQLNSNTQYTEPLNTNTNVNANANTIKKNVKKVNYKCVHCNESFPKRELLRTHKRIEHGSIVSSPNANPLIRKSVQLYQSCFQCPICDRRFTKEHMLRIHLTKKHRIQKNNTSETKAQELKSVQLLQSRYQCPKCNKTFTTTYNLRIHFTRHHINKKEDSGDIDDNNMLKPVPQITYSCPMCTKVSTTRGLLLSHYTRIHDGKLHLCSICNWKYMDEMSLQKHINEKHNKSFQPDLGVKNEVIVCNVCNEQFLNKSTYALHLVTHFSQQFKCQMCDKEFLQQDHFEKHQLTHLKTESVDDLETIADKL